MKSVLVIQNHPHEGAGQMASALSRRGYDSHYVLGPTVDQAMLKPDRFSSLIVLGGAQGAYETDKYPYLEDQMRVCRDFIDAGKPIAGFCLGAQLLASAVGGKVLPNEQKEIGWYDIALTGAAADDPLMRDHPQTLLASFPRRFHPRCARRSESCLIKNDRLSAVPVWLKRLRFSVSRGGRPASCRSHVSKQ